MKPTGAHPAADQFPALDDDSFDALVHDIAANGVLWPVIVDAEGLVVDGRHRWKACQSLGIDVPTVDLGDRDPYAVALSANVETKPMSSGQRAMHRALDLARQGRRKNGRWSRGTVDVVDSHNSDKWAWRDSLKKAGAVIDTANRAARLVPGPGLDASTLSDYCTLPQQVTAGTISLDYAHQKAKQFHQVATLAEFALYEPLVKYTGEVNQLARDFADRYGTPPAIDAPLRREDRDQLDQAAKAFAEAARTIRAYLKEAK